MEQYQNVYSGLYKHDTVLRYMLRSVQTCYNIRIYVVARVNVKQF